MNDDVRLSLGQFRRAWEIMCGGAPAYTAASHEGLQYVFSGLPIPFFNVALLTAAPLSGDALAARAHDACAWASGKAVPWLFVVTNEALEPGVNAAEVLDGCGLAPMLPLTGMIATHVDAPERLPDGLQLAVPEDDQGCAALVDVNAAAYATSLDAAKPLIGVRSFWSGHVPVLGQVDDRPASCAAVLNVDGCRYVALVATDPAQQRRGFAEAAMRHALDVAARAHGPRPTVLHATDAGRPIYARMGYEPVSSHLCFIEKRFMDAH